MKFLHSMYVIKTSLLGLLLGVGATIFFAQYDPWVHKKIETHFLKALQNAFQCNVTGTIHSVNFFSPAVTFENMQVCPRDASGWSWHAGRYTTSFSWGHFFTYSTMDLSVTINEFNVRSTISSDGALAIAPHIKNLMMSPNVAIPLFLKNLTLHKTTFIIEHPKLAATICWNSESKKINDKFRSNFAITDAQVSFDQKVLFKNMGGTFLLDVMNGLHGATCTVQTDCHADVPSLGADSTQSLCFLSGFWNIDRGQWNAHSMDHALEIIPLVVSYAKGIYDVEIAGRMPISFVSLCSGTNIPLAGSCALTMKGSFGAHSQLTGTMSCDELTCPHVPGSLALATTFSKKDAQWSGDMSMKCALVPLHGSWHWDESHERGDLVLHNNDAIINPLNLSPYWKINSRDLSLSLEAHKNKINSSYKCAVSNELRNTSRRITGTIQADSASGECELGGTCRDIYFGLSANLYTAPFLKTAYYHENDKTLVTFDQKDDAGFQARIHMPLIRTIMSNFFQYDWGGEGILHINGKPNGSLLECDAHLADGAIRLAQTYNFINGFDAHFSLDLTKRVGTLRNLTCSLYNGSIRAIRGTMWFDADWAPSFIHVPVTFDRCLINSKKDLFAIASGRLLISKLVDKPYLLKGALFLERSQLKENIFSEGFQKTLMNATSSLQATNDPKIVCDLIIQTKDPVRIDTDFLHANAQIRLAIKDSLFDPNISGIINILSGTLKFPYKPLQISRGAIQFLSDQPRNPLVELLAKNNIKNHYVTLQVTGSLRDHFILLESTPPLTQEQIVSLLLAGAHDESLGAVIPALLMQNVTNLMFSSQQAGLSGVLDRYVKPWMKQLQVNLVPRLSDVGGRGGLRGALEIKVNDRWRAMIEKNFSLTEDTRFELEYLLSDDVKFRVIRDERFDVGGEVEMSWKF